MLKCTGCSKQYRTAQRYESHLKRCSQIPSDQKTTISIQDSVLNREGGRSKVGNGGRSRIERDRLRNDLDNAIAEIQDLKDVHRLEIQKLKDQYEEDLDEIFESRDEIEEEMENVKKEYDIRISQLEEQKQSIEKSLTIEKRNNESVYSNLNHTIEELKYQLEKRKAEYKSAVDTLQLRIRDIETRYNTDIQKYKNLLEQQIHESARLKKQYEEQLVTLNNNYTIQKQTDLQRLQTENSKLRTDVQQLSKRVTSMQLSEANEAKSVEERYRKILYQKDHEMDILKNHTSTRLAESLKSYNEKIDYMKKEFEDIKTEIVKKYEDKLRDTEKHEEESIKIHTRKLERQVQSLRVEIDMQKEELTAQKIHETEAVKTKEREVANMFQQLLAKLESENALIRDGESAKNIKLCKEHKETVEKMERYIASLNSDIQKRDQSIKLLNRDIENLKKQHITNMDRQNATHDQYIKTQESKWNTIKSDYEKRISKLKTDIQTERDLHASKITDLESQSLEKARVLAAQLQTRDKEIQKLKTDIQDVRNKSLNDLGKEKDKLVVEYFERTEKTQKKFEETIHEVTKRKDGIISKLNQKLSESESQYKLVKLELEEKLSTALKQLEETRQTLTQFNTEYQKSISKLKSESDNILSSRLNEAIKTEKVKYNELYTTLEARTAEWKYIQKQLEDEHNKKLVDTSRAMSEKIRDLESQIKSITTQKNTMAKSLIKSNMTIKSQTQTQQQDTHSLTVHIERLETQVKNQTQSITSLTSSLRSEEKKTAMYMKELTTLRDEKEKLFNDNMRVKELASRVEEQNQHIKNITDSHERMIIQKDRKIEDRDLAIGNHIKIEAQKDVEISELNSILKDIKLKYQQLVNTTSKQDREIGFKLDKNSEQISKLNSLNDKLKQDINSLQQCLNIKDGQITQYTKDIKSLQSSHEKLRNCLKVEENKVQKLNNEMTITKNQLSTMIDDQQIKLSEKDSLIQQMNTSLDKLKKEVTSLSTANNRIRNDLQKTVEDRDRLSKVSHKSELTQDDVVESLKSQIQTFKKTIDDSNAMLLTARREKDQVHKSLSEKITILTSQLSELRVRESSIKSTLANVQKSLYAEQQKCIIQERKYLSTISQLEQKQTELEKTITTSTRQAEHYKSCHDELRAQYAEIQKRVTELQNHKIKTERSLEQATNKLTIIQSQMDIIDREKRTLATELGDKNIQLELLKEQTQTKTSINAKESANHVFELNKLSRSLINRDNTIQELTTKLRRVDEDFREEKERNAKIQSKLTNASQQMESIETRLETITKQSKINLTKKNDEIETIQKKLQESLDKLDKDQLEIKNLRSSISSVMSEKHSYEQQLVLVTKKYQQELSDIKANMVPKSQHINIQPELDRVKTQVNYHWEKEMSKIKKEMAGYISDIHNLEMKIKSMNKDDTVKIQLLKQSHEKECQTMRKKIEDINQKCTDQISSISKQRDDLLKELSSIRSEVEQMDATNTGFKRDITFHKNTIQTLRKELDVLSVQKDEIEKLYKKKSDELVSISKGFQTKTQSLVVDRNKLQMQIQSQETKIADLNTKIETLLEAKNTLEKRLSTSVNNTSQERIKMTTEISNREKSIIELRDTLKRNERIISDYEKDIGTLNKKLNDMNTSHKAEQMRICQEYEIKIQDAIKSGKVSYLEIESKLKVLKDQYRKLQDSHQSEMNAVLTDKQVLIDKCKSLEIDIRSRPSTQELEMSIGEKYRTQISQLKHNISDQESHIQSLKKKFKESSDKTMYDLDMANKQAREYKTQLSVMTNEANDKTRNKDSIIKQYSTRIEELESRVETLNTNLSKKSTEIKLIEKQKEAIKDMTQKELKAYGHIEQQLKSRIEALQKELSVCKSPEEIQIEARKVAAKDIVKLEEKLREAVNKANKIFLEKEEIRISMVSQLEKLQDEYDQTQKVALNLHKEKDVIKTHLTKEIEKLNGDIRSMKTKLDKSANDAQLYKTRLTETLQKIKDIQQAFDIKTRAFETLAENYNDSTLKLNKYVLVVKTYKKRIQDLLESTSLLSSLIQAYIIEFSKSHEKRHNELESRLKSYTNKFIAGTKKHREIVTQEMKTIIDSSFMSCSELDKTHSEKVNSIQKVLNSIIEKLIPEQV